LVGDVAGAADYLRALPTSNGKVGVIGYCSGGRQSVLAACNLELDAAIDCYGAFVTGTPPEGFPLQVTNLVDQLPNLRAPLLGLFGNDDQYPTPEHVDELDEILNREGKAHEFHRYDGAGHAFFSADRPSYRVEAANDGWERIEAFLKTHLGG
jgi:carboxymethylenebutenolidase